MKVTLRMIADRVGVSGATVSLALRNDAQISPARREEIRRVAEELGYRPNALVASLMSHIRQAKPPPRHTGLLYLVTGASAGTGEPGTTPDLLFRGAVEQAARRGFNLQPFWLREPGLTEARIDRILRARGIPGVIVGPRADALPLPRLPWERLSAVMNSPSYPEPGLDRVFTHFYTSIRMAMAFVERHRHPPVRLILPATHDRNVDHLWTASYLHSRVRQRYLQRPLIVEAPERAIEWVARNPGGTVVGTNLVLDWLDAAGLADGKDFRFVSLNVENRTDITGVRESNWDVGAESADMLISRIHLNRTGLPAKPLTTLVEPGWQQGRWEPGPSRS